MNGTYKIPAVDSFAGTVPDIKNKCCDVNTLLPITEVISHIIRSPPPAKS